MRAQSFKRATAAGGDLAGATDPVARGAAAGIEGKGADASRLVSQGSAGSELTGTEDTGSDGAAVDAASLAADVVAGQDPRDTGFVAPPSARGYLARLVRRPADVAPDGNLTFQARRRRARWLRRVSVGPGHIQALVALQRSAEREAKDAGLHTAVKYKHRHLLGGAVRSARAAADVATEEELRRAGKRAARRQREVARVVERQKAAELAAAMARGDSSAMRAVTPAAERARRAEARAVAAAMAAAGKAEHAADGLAGRSEELMDRETSSAVGFDLGDVGGPGEGGSSMWGGADSSAPGGAGASSGAGGRLGTAGGQSEPGLVGDPAAPSSDYQLPPAAQPAKSVPLRRVVPYQAQGDLSWYALDKLLLRRKLRDEAPVQRALRRYWRAFSRYEGGSRVVSRSTYISLMSRAYLILVPDAGALARAAGSGVIAPRGANATEEAQAEAEAVARFEWERDTWRGDDEDPLRSLDEPGLARSLFELADMWCETATAREYTQMLLWLLARISPRHAGCDGKRGSPKPPAPGSRWQDFEHPSLPAAPVGEALAVARCGTAESGERGGGMPRRFDAPAIALPLGNEQFRPRAEGGVPLGAAQQLGQSLFAGSGAAGSAGSSVVGAAVASAGGSLAAGRWERDDSGAWFNTTVDSAIRQARSAIAAEEALQQAKASAIAAAAAQALDEASVSARRKAAEARLQQQRARRNQAGAGEGKPTRVKRGSLLGAKLRAAVRTVQESGPPSTPSDAVSDDETGASSAEDVGRTSRQSAQLGAGADAVASEGQGASAGGGKGTLSQVLAVKVPLGIGPRRRPRLWELYGVRPVRVAEAA
ncbi:hypothetical protein FNF31_04926 [Cafeteria roenbergensis]|uniref:Uncharacterized protein n=1 Tax=Cafeteria roenbergensis TaxID=33653 RepID=A0A5A8CTU6_CAFRO|nr:hypothetical protein FNF28_06672 [Cafeteria roenbergensis]KAA0159339.1 hypothetical protein FNF31_04926 [Cafeteria roenbergensis]